MLGAVKFAVGALITVLMAISAHSWLGLGDAFINKLESEARSALGNAGGGLMRLSFVRDPALARDAIISGDADPATRTDLLAAVQRVPGVRNVRWHAAGGNAVPLAIEE
jgi:hypothetical protein